MDTKSPTPPLDVAPHRFPEVIRRADPRTRLLAGIAAVIGVLALAWYFFGGGPPKPAAPAPPVHVATAGRENVDVIEQTIGTVVPVSTVNVVPQVTGQLVAAPFQEGQIVHTGDLLFQIDPRPFQAALEQAQAALAKDQATLVSALNDERRYSALYAQNAGSQQQRDQAVATAKADAATVQSDRAAIDTARINLGFTQIRSPINGKTGPIMIQPGNLVTASGANPLVTITQLQPMKVSLFLPQNDVPQIQLQMAAHALTAVVPMPGATGGRETAQVDFVGNVVSAQTGTIELRATFDNDDNRLVPGQTVSVSVTLRNLDNAVVVPRNAVNAGPDNSYVYIVDKDSRAVQKIVTVLNDDGTNDAIAGDVKPGDRIIVDGQLRVVPGAAVAVMNGTPPATAPALPPGAQ